MTDASATPAWLGETSGRVRLLAVAPAAGIALGDFRCDPGDPAWHTTNEVGDAPHVVFPGTPVEITASGAAPSTVDATQVVLHDPRRPYRRRLVDPRGDRCTFLALRPDVFSELSAGRGHDPAALLRTVRAPSDARSVLGVGVLRRAVRTDRLDPLELETALLDAAAAALPVGERHDARTATTPAARRAHARLVEDARAWIGVHHAEAWQLDDVARAVASSPFHLHRVFRATTGTTIQRYRDALRLRSGLARVLDGESISTVALDVGYASHSHFTARFRRDFGVTPSAVRQPGEARKIVTVMSGGRS